MKSVGLAKQTDVAPIGVAITIFALFAVGSGLTAHAIATRLPSSLWWQTISAPDLTDPRQLIVAYDMIPRVVTAWLCGASLSLAGVVFQQITRNPLAEPTTLGTSAGAFLALTAALTLTPALAGLSQEAIALVGAGLASALVFGLASHHSFAPIPLVLTGMVVSLTCGTAASILLLFGNPYDLSLYLWGAGSLSQHDWTVVYDLLFGLLPSVVAIAILVRPLELIALEEASARSLGLRLLWPRGVALFVGVVLSGSVVCAVGVIGFVGLVAPAVTRLCGGRRLIHQLLFAPMIGAGLLWSTDQIVLLIAGGGRELMPTGAATAIFGAPVMLGVLARHRFRSAPPTEATHSPRARKTGTIMFLMLLALVACTATSLIFGRSATGWHWSSFAQAADLLPWRGPRLMAALAAGAMLATAGGLLQRITGNAMASPEVLGIGSGAAAGVLVSALIISPTNQAMPLLAATFGALSVLGIILILGWRSDFAPHRVLLTGVAVTAFLNALSAAAFATGNPHITSLRIWMVGSTDFVTPSQAILALGAALILIALVPVANRWLRIVPLGGEMTNALGVSSVRSRVLVLLWASILSAAATLIVGPLGFVGLMAPHMARLLGLHQPTPHLIGAALLGGLIMVGADWVGRSALFPYQLPAGLLAAVVGGPYFFVLMRRSAS